MTQEAIYMGRDALGNYVVHLPGLGEDRLFYRASEAKAYAHEMNGGEKRRCPFDDPDYALQCKGVSGHSGECWS